MRSTEKKYYKIKEVSEMLDIPISTLHFWERQFTVLSPRRSRGNDRLYTTDDIEKIKMVHYLVKVRGMKLAEGDLLSDIYWLEGDNSTEVEFHDRVVHINRLRIGTRDGKGTRQK